MGVHFWSLAMQSKERSPKFNKSIYMDPYDDEFSIELTIDKTSASTHDFKKEVNFSTQQKTKEPNHAENSLASKETSTDCIDIVKNGDLEYMMENVKLRAVPGKTNESFFGLSDDSKSNQSIVDIDTCNKKVIIEKKPIKDILSIETTQSRAKIECQVQKSRHKRENKATLLRRAQMEEKRNAIDSKKKCI